ncbi:MAG: hypothetical protein CMH28_05115 [Micavibrio sp.]|nr:hypothetical protein [Micavibrio sp.]
MNKFKSGMAVLLPAALAFSACSGPSQQDTEQQKAEAYADALNEAAHERFEAEIVCSKGKNSNTECAKHMRNAHDAAQEAESIMDQEIRENYNPPKPL